MCLLKIVYFTEDSFLSDSSFEDYDDDASEIDITGDAAEPWRPDVYFHSYLDMKVRIS